MRFCTDLYVFFSKLVYVVRFCAVGLVFVNFFLDCIFVRNCHSLGYLYGASQNTLWLEDPFFSAKYEPKHAFANKNVKNAFDSYLVVKTEYSDNNEYIIEYHVNNQADENFRTKMHKRKKNEQNGTKLVL